MGQGGTGLDASVEKAAIDFALKVRAAPAVAEFWEARTRLEADQEAQKLLAELQSRQEALMQKAQGGRDPSQSEIDALRQLQKEVFRNSTLREYFRTQQLAQAFWPQVNQELSRVLNVDFSTLARSGG